MTLRLLQGLGWLGAGSAGAVAGLVVGSLLGSRLGLAPDLGRWLLEIPLAAAALSWGAIRAGRRATPPPPAPRTPSPPRPADWTHTLEDLMAEAKAGKRDRIGQPELTWARDYERSLLPPDIRAPRPGDVYAVREDMEAEFITAWTGPFSGGGKGLLRAGEQVEITSVGEGDPPLGAFARAVDYAGLEARLVPAATRCAGKYAGFHFWFSTRELAERFVLVREGR